MTNHELKGASNTSPLSASKSRVSVSLIFTGVKPKTSSVTFVKSHTDTESMNPDLSYEIATNEEDLDDSLHIGPHVKPKPERRTLLLPKAKLEDLRDHIPFENVFQVDQGNIDQFNDSNEKNSKDLFDIMLNRHASLNVAAEVASAQIEAVMEKCLDSPIEPDIDLPNMLDFVNQLDTLNFFLSRSAIPESQANLIIDKSLDKLIGDWQAKTKTAIRSETMRRHREELNNADPETNSAFAVKRSRSG